MLCNSEKTKAGEATCIWRPICGNDTKGQHADPPEGEELFEALRACLRQPFTIIEGSNKFLRINFIRSEGGRYSAIKMSLDNRALANQWKWISLSSFTELKSLTDLADCFETED